MLKENPYACFQVDKILSLNNWESLIGWGNFEILKGADARNALHKLVGGLREILKDSHPQVKYLSEMSHSQIMEEIPILYRIKLDEVSGRKMQPVSSTIIPQNSIYQSNVGFI